MVRVPWERQGGEQKGPEAQKEAGAGQTGAAGGGQGKEEMTTSPSSPNLLSGRLNLQGN